MTTRPYDRGCKRRKRLPAISVGIAGIAFASPRYLPRLTHLFRFHYWRMTHLGHHLDRFHVKSAEGKRSEFVSAKKKAGLYQGRAAKIERTEHGFEP